MKVLMISFDYTICPQNTDVSGDARERHLRYASALRALYPDGQITVVVKAPPGYSPQEQTLSEGLSVYPVPCRRWAFLLKARDLIGELARKVHFDLITTQTPFDDGLLGLWVKHRFGFPLNVQMRSSFLDLKPWIAERPIIYRVFNEIGKLVSHRADSIRVVSQGEKQRLESLFPKLKDKIVALHPLVNVETFQRPLENGEKTETQEILRRHGMEERPFLLFVGRLVPQKNLPTLLRAFAIARQTRRDAVLVIAGTGPLEQDLRGLAKKLELENHILWLGKQSLQALRGWYSEARATLLPSFHEGVAKVIIESYLMNTPVIAAPFICARELFAPDVTGIVMGSFTNVDELARHMLRMLESFSLAEEMGRKGKAHIQAYLHSEAAYMERLIEIWRQTACAE